MFELSPCNKLIFYAISYYFIITSSSKHTHYTLNIFLFPCSWWKDLNLAAELPYMRDRLMESYLSAMITYFEPCYSRARVILCKFVKVMTFIDDTFDSYGTLEELHLFTQAVHRFFTF